MESKSSGFTDNMHSFQSWSINLFSSIDFIGRKPKLKLNQKARNKTVLGGVLCILMFAIFIPAALYFGQELVYRVLPKIIETAIPIGENDYISISKNAFSFYIYLRNSKGRLYSLDGYLDLSLEVITIMNSDNPDSITSSTKALEMKSCDANDFPNNTSVDHGIPYAYLNQLKCIKESANTTIRGSNHQNEFSILRLNLQRCHTANCKPLEDIDKQLKTSQLVFKYFDTEYNQREFKNYYNLHIKEELFSLSSQVDKQVVISLKKTEFYTDIGYMFEDFRLKTFHNIAFIKEKDYMSLKNNFSVDFLFCLDYSKAVNYRKYYKFQNWVAELGGIVKAISLIATILNYFNDKSSYYQLMINKLFDVDDIIKYYQYFDIDHVTTSKKKRKRDSIVLLNAKKEKDYFEKEGLNRINTEKHSFTNNLHPLIKKNSNKLTTVLSKADFDPSNVNNYCLPSNIHMPANPNTGNNNDNTSNQNKNANTMIRHMPTSNILQSNENNSDLDPNEAYIANLKKSKATKEHFDKVKKDRFSLNMFEQIVFCFCNKKENPKFNALIGGKELLTERSDIIYILKKSLEFDRLKNLILRDNQILLLNSLTKFMLDPERVNLIDFKHCNFDKFIDSYDDVASGNDMIDIKLAKWVETKFKFDHSSLK